MLSPPAPTLNEQASPRATEVVHAVEAVLSLPEEELDYARAKVALDAIVDPAADADWTLAELDRLTEAAWRLAGGAPSETDRLRAVRAMI